ncbi:hypothetical protein ACJJTC_012913 [Scirpophaga incertulas]
MSWQIKVSGRSWTEAGGENVAHVGYHIKYSQKNHSSLFHFSSTGKPLARGPAPGRRGYSRLGSWQRPGPRSSSRTSWLQQARQLAEAGPEVQLQDVVATAGSAAGRGRARGPAPGRRGYSRLGSWQRPGPRSSSRTSWLQQARQLAEAGPEVQLQDVVATAGSAAGRGRARGPAPGRRGYSRLGSWQRPGPRSSSRTSWLQQARQLAEAGPEVQLQDVVATAGSAAGRGRARGPAPGRRGYSRLGSWQRPGPRSSSRTSWLQQARQLAEAGPEVQLQDVVATAGSAAGRGRAPGPAPGRRGYSRLGSWQRPGPRSSSRTSWLQQARQLAEAGPEVQLQDVVATAGSAAGRGRARGPAPGRRGYSRLGSWQRPGPRSSSRTSWLQQARQLAEAGPEVQLQDVVATAGSAAGRGRARGPAPGRRGYSRLGSWQRPGPRSSSRTSWLQQARQLAEAGPEVQLQDVVATAGSAAGRGRARGPAPGRRGYSRLGSWQRPGPRSSSRMSCCTATLSSCMGTGAVCQDTCRSRTARRRRLRWFRCT